MHQKLLPNAKKYANKKLIGKPALLAILIIWTMDFVMIIDGNNKKQRSILTNKCFYQTTAQIMRDFESKGYANSADETAKVITAYHDIVKKRTKNNFNADYNAAFQRIDKAIDSLANKVFYDYDKKKHDEAYRSFEEFDYVGAIVNRQLTKTSLSSSQS